MRVELSVGDVIETKKQHPCGCKQWKVLRTGADIRLKCEKCGRLILLEYEDFCKRYKKTVSHADATGENDG